MLDETDRRILEILGKDARKPFKSVAGGLGVTDATVHNRVKNMLRKGVIKNFTTDLDFSKLGFDVEFLLEMNVSPQNVGPVSDELAEHDEVYEIITSAGSKNLIAKVRVEDMQKMQKFMNEVVNSIRAIEGVEVNVITGKIKERRGI
jgi:Lrp/AsnC family transcriptional regulator for asnA, asnC and gidA